MNSTRRFLFSILAMTGIMTMGAIGYMMIEGWSPLDSLYMTVITLSTVGYGETHPTSEAGKFFTIILILTGGGFALYVAGIVVQFIVEGRLQTALGRHRLDTKIRKLSGHYIVCGYGRIGRVLCNNLREKPIDLVAIEKDPALIRTMDEDHVLYLHGDASDETLLRQAGIDRAKALVAALATDTDNVFLVLTARQLNPDLFIMARCGHAAARKKLFGAGASMVESPYEMGARSMAMRLLRPAVTDFIDSALAQKNHDIQLEELPVSPDSRMCGMRLAESGIRQQYNLIVIGVQRTDGTMEFNPHHDAEIRGGDTIIAMGEVENLDALEGILSGRKK